jgi:hypothetical protein
MLGFKYKNQAKYWGRYPLDDNSFLSKLRYVMMCNLKFHSDWNWLMESVEFINKNIKTSNDTQDAKIGELFIDEWKFRVKQYYLRIIQWTENGWRMFDGKENSELSMFYIIGENCESEKEAVFLIVSDFAKLYNEGKARDYWLEQFKKK